MASITTKAPKETGKQLPGSPEGLGLRMLKAIEAAGWDRSVESIGKSARSLDRYVKGEAEPPVSVITSLAECSGYSLRWIASGEGPELQADVDRVSDGEATAPIPRLDVRASAGFGASGDGGEMIETIDFPRDFLRASGVTPANARILSVSGDSMEPTLNSGDLLLVDVSVKRIRNEALYVLVRDDDVYVKRAQRRLNGTVLITSDNTRYPPEEFSEADADRLLVAGRVAWYGRSL